MAANATVLLSDLSGQITKYQHALDNAPAGDQIPFAQWYDLRTTLDCTQEKIIAALATQPVLDLDATGLDITAIYHHHLYADADYRP